MTTTISREETRNFVFQHRFHDVDQLSEQVRFVQPECWLIQLSTTCLHCDISLIGLEEAIFVFTESSCPVLCKGEKCLQSLGRPDLDEHFWDSNYLHIPATLPSVRGYLTQIMNLTQHQPSFFQQPHFKKLVLEDFIPLLVDAMPPADWRLFKPPASLTRSQLVQQAEDYMMAHIDQPITLKDLCTALHVSRKPLFYGFQEAFGISPMEYLKVQRMHSVRQMLKAADPQQDSVTAIARQFGFWSAGHFTRDYKQMFGELPSETLKRVPSQKKN
jgi:AraC family ethanolamine operon transcriptional activator